MDKPVEYLSSTVDTVHGTLDKSMEWLNNKTVTNVVLLVLVIYSAFFVGKVWPKGMDLFKHPLVKVALFLVVAFVGSKNPSLAIAATIAIVTIMMTNLKETKEFLTVVGSEKLDTDDNVYEAIMGRCICRCDGNDCDCKCADEDPQELDPETIVAEEEQVKVPVKPESELPSCQAQGNVSDMDNFRDLNEVAKTKLQQQWLDHEQDLKKNQINPGYVGCGCNSPPNYKRRTPFRRLSYFNRALAKTVNDAEYEGFLYQ
jgi:hypothetical protein